jgi:hypothetical protein
MWESRNKGRIAHKNAKRRATKLNATPLWLNENHEEIINWYYKVAACLSDITGTDYHVDHIHPLQGRDFSGLHVPWNLRVIPACDNIRKHNRLPEKDLRMAWSC